MILLSDNELHTLLNEDVPFGDPTTSSFGIDKQHARMTFATRDEPLILSCTEEVVRLSKMFGLEVVRTSATGTYVEKKTIFLELHGEAGTIHRLWKTLQNLLDYASGIATYTHQLVTSARQCNPDIIIATTRKTVPFSKKIAIKSIEAGGAIAHRLGLSESILVFDYHRVFFATDELFTQAFYKLKRSNLEQKIVVEVENLDDALRFASLGADILQLEKFSLSTLKDDVAILRSKFPNLLLMATGGINLANVQPYTQCGVDVIVTSSPYSAKPADIKVKIEPL